MPFRTVDAGVAIAVRLRPGASANRIDGIQTMADGRAWLSVRVTAVPERGKANRAMMKLLGEAWHVSGSDLSVVAGAKDRNKTILLCGDPKLHLQMLNKWGGTQPRG